MVDGGCEPDFDERVAVDLRRRVTVLAGRHPLYPNLGESNRES
jgi:hypothetical protein